MMKRFIFALAILAIGLWTYSPARADVASGEQTSGASTTVVYPTGQFPADVNNVQAAVNLGGAVLLKATNAASVYTPFNFGPAVEGSGTIFLNTDVRITGETVAGRMTTISGGDTPFRSYVPVATAFHKLSFDGPRMAAVLVLETSRFEFSRSRVARVVPFLWYTEDGVDVYKGQGIWVDVAGTTPGAIVIEDNVFDDCGLGGAQLGYGLAIVSGESRVRIARNLISGANLAGIILIWPGGETVIEDNTIVTGPGDIEPRFHGNGIHLLGAWEREQNTPVIIRNNEIRVEGQEAEGIFAFGDEVFNFKVQNTVIEKNRITVTSGLTGIGLWGEVWGSQIRNNRIRGDAEYAMLLGAGFFDPTEPSMSNLFAGNNIATFDASVADVFFDTNTVNNVLRGHSGTVIDLGTGNIITGTRINLPSQAEEQLRNDQRAMQRRPGLTAQPNAKHP
jgi:hypothetical protein